MAALVQKKILVIGATGNQGTGVVRHCTAAGHAVYAFVRNIHSEGAVKLKDSYSVSLVQGDIDDADFLKTTAQGMDAVFFILTQAGAEVEQRRARNVIAAVQASNSASTIIFSSALWTGEQEKFPDWGPSHAMYQYWIGKHGSEEIVRGAAGVKHWIIVRPAMFLQDFVPPISRILFPDLASRATLRVGFKREDKINFIDASDVGLLATAAVSRPEQYSGRVFELSLPPMTIREIADKMTVGKGAGAVKVEYVDADELASEVGERLVAAQRLFSSIGCHPRASNQGLNLTSPETFFRGERNQGATGELRLGDL